MSYKYSGIDISKWQVPDKMNWEQIAKDHKFVIIRACYGVKSDWAFDLHFKAARENHVLVGAYIFYRQSQGWQEQFEAFKGELDRVGFGEDDILPVVDLEWNEKYDGEVDPAKFNTDAKALVEKLAETYGGCILYLAPGFYQILGKPEWMLQYPWWIAHFGVTQPWCPWKSWIIWQYTGEGRTAGYSGQAIDLNHADEMPPVVDLISDVEDHLIPDLTDREAYEDVESIVYEPEDPPEPPTLNAPLARVSLFQRLLAWVRLWILSHKN